MMTTWFWMNVPLMVLAFALTIGLSYALLPGSRREAQPPASATKAAPSAAAIASAPAVASAPAALAVAPVTAPRL